METGGRFCLASVAEKMFSHLIYNIKTFYKFFTLNGICKYSAAINYIFSPEGGVGLVPKCGCLLTLAYYAFPR
jgi:hypothetical protein